MARWRPATVRASWHGLVIAGLLFLLLSKTAFAQSASYTYDALNRLTRVVYADGTTITYAYDAAGNRLSLTANVPCATAINVTSATFAGVGESATVQVTTTNGCPWTASANDAFLTVTAGATGSASGSVTFHASENVSGATRQGTLTIARHTFTVTQTGVSVFTDDPLQAGVTPLKVVHIAELRSYVDQLRSRYRLRAFTWTDPKIVAGVTPIKAVHLAELRAALDAVYVAAGRELPRYSSIAAGTTVITVAQLAEIRAAIRAIY